MTYHASRITYYSLFIITDRRFESMISPITQRKTAYLSNLYATKFPPLINTQLQLGGGVIGGESNRFNGFSPCFLEAIIQYCLMSLHSYSQIWIHPVWAALERRPLLSRGAVASLSA